MGRTPIFRHPSSSVVNQIIPFSQFAWWNSVNAQTPIFVVIGCTRKKSRNPNTLNSVKNFWNIPNKQKYNSRIIWLMKTNIMDCKIAVGGSPWLHPKTFLVCNNYTALNCGRANSKAFSNIMAWWSYFIHNVHDFIPTQEISWEILLP